MARAQGHHHVHPFATAEHREADQTEVGQSIESGITATDMAVADLSKPRADSAYPHGGRMIAPNANAERGTPPSVVADTVLDIASDRTTSFRTLCGPDAHMFIGLRNSMADEEWIAMSDTIDDSVFFERLGTASGVD